VGIGTTITTNPVDVSNTKKLAVGVVTANQVYSSTVNVGTGVTLYGSTGIVSATKFYGDGSSLTGVSAPTTGVTTTAPVGPTNGQQWFDTSDGNTYIWYASQNVWVVSQTYGY
jgi:hypothetical protein